MADYLAEMWVAWKAGWMVLKKVVWLDEKRAVRRAAWRAVATAVAMAVQLGNA